MGIEPTSLPWEGSILPVNYTRDRIILYPIGSGKLLICRIKWVYYGVDMQNHVTYKDRKNKKRDRFYILLSVVLVVGFFVWGIPAIINLTTNKNVNRLELVDTIPPQVPVIGTPPEATNSSPIAISGYTEAGAKVELLVNSMVVDSKVARDDGSFDFLPSLEKDQNEIQIKASDAAGNQSQSQVYKILYDITPINLSIDSPKDGSEYYGRNNNIIDIVGSVDKEDVTVLINNSFASIDRDGNISARYQLQEGSNEIRIRANDKAGNVS
jgi:hypothetical protein